MNGNSIAKPYLLVTNRHFAQKKFEYAIEALKFLSSDVQLVIAGEPTEYTKELQKKYVSEKKHITFVGLLSESELDKAYAYAAVYLYPAPEEDFGMGIIEAMAHGTPVVAWGNAGPSGIITHGEDGFLAKPFDVGNFAKHVNRLLQNKALYQEIVDSAYENIEESFTYENHVRIISIKIKQSIVQWRAKEKKARVNVKQEQRLRIIAIPKWGKTHVS